MNEYLVEVVKGKDGKLHQKQLGKIDNVKDPCKEQKIGPCAPKTLSARTSIATIGRPPPRPGGGFVWRRRTFGCRLFGNNALLLSAIKPGQPAGGMCDEAGANRGAARARIRRARS